MDKVESELDKASLQLDEVEAELKDLGEAQSATASGEHRVHRAKTHSDAVNLDFQPGGTCPRTQSPRSPRLRRRQGMPRQYWTGAGGLQSLPPRLVRGIAVNEYPFLLLSGCVLIPS